MNINDINHAIMFGNFTNDQLNGIAMSIKYARNQLVQKNKNEISVGAQVKFTSGTKGIITGTVAKINRKSVIVKEHGKMFDGTWKVPANMLEVVQ
jgi:uncharacterized protein YkvS